MSSNDSLLERCEKYFTADRNEEQSTLIFIRALQGFALIKCLTLWTVGEIISAVVLSRPGSVIGKVMFLPSAMIENNFHIGFGMISIALILMLFLKPDYITNILLFWIALNLFKVKFPVTNGSDYVLLALTIYAIPMSFRKAGNETIEAWSIGLFNLSRLLAGIQIALIYLISAWDKILSPVWRSGEAFVYIRNIDTSFNPVLLPFVKDQPVSLILSWITILFEFLFVIFIWQKRTRLLILCVGIIFHLGIWFMLSLPDFALLMIVSYAIFLKDTDLSNLRAKLRPQPR